MADLPVTRYWALTLAPGDVLRGGNRLREAIPRLLGVTSRTEFGQEGLVFHPWLISRRMFGLRDEYLLVRWEDIGVVDMTHIGPFGPAKTTIATIYDRAGQRVLSLGVDIKAFTLGLRQIGLIEHDRPSWPGRGLFLPPGQEPDWSMLNG